jgi:hypothetical protein
MIVRSPSDTCANGSTAGAVCGGRRLPVRNLRIARDPNLRGVLIRLRERFPAGYRGWLRVLREGNPFRIERPTEPAPIGPLVSPFRYDILLRARHFDFHAQHRELFASDFHAYERRARTLPYFVWFTRASWFAARLDGEQLEAAWHARLRDSAALFESFGQRGFDTAHPVVLHAGRRVLPAPTGKRAQRDLYAGDGNHRVALLIAAGQLELLPAQYRVKRYRSLVPADTTGFLFGVTGGSWTEYVSFIALGYPDVRLIGPAGGPRVEADDPAIRAEVEAAVGVDLQFAR